MVALAGLYLVVDARLQWRLATYGAVGTARSSRSISCLERWLDRLGPRWVLRWTCLLSLLRIQYGRWIVLGGFLYPFCWQVFAQREAPGLTVVAYTGMVLLPQSAHRGNLLGMERRGIWRYALWGLWGEELIRAKNSALTLLQGFMILGAVLPALLPSITQVDEVKEWIYVIGFAAMLLALNEAAGVFFHRHVPGSDRSDVALLGLHLHRSLEHRLHEPAPGGGICRGG